MSRFMRYRSNQRSIRLLAVLMSIVLISGTTGELIRLRAQDTPITIVVNMASDDDQFCDRAVSLRCAVDFATANIMSPTFITFNADYTIYLNSQIVIAIDAQPITIDGGAHKIVIDGNNSTRIFWTRQGEVTLSNLTVRNGANYSTVEPAGKGGGAILNGGTLTINHSLFYANNGSDGGAISTFGSLTVNNSVFTGNSALDCGGALENSAGHWDNNTITVLNNVEMTNNFAGGGVSTGTPLQYDASNGGAVCNDGKIIINHSTLSHNMASSSGGAIDTGLELILNSSTLSDNMSRYEGGAIASSFLSIINSSTFIGNSTRGTDAEHGNGGGAINTESSTDRLMVTNSTFYGNYDEMGSGGAILALGHVMVSNSTFTQNTALYGGGIFITDKAMFNILSSIVFNNRSEDGDGYPSDINGKIHSVGHNLIGTDRDNAGVVDGMNNDIVVAYHTPHGDPQLGDLVGALGFPPAIALGPGSLAIGAGDCSGSTAVNPPIPPQPLDQRGFKRNTKCDIGAYETSTLFAVTATPTNTPASPTDLPPIGTP